MTKRLKPASRCGVAVLLTVMGVAAGVALADDDADDVQRLVKALELGSGAAVAEIGAGSGGLTLAVARAVGPAGRVYSSELGADRLTALRKAVDQAGLDNVTIVESAATETQLPQQCCDAIFMRNIYHHFADPAAMNASLRLSLKPCGRLAVLDFARRAGRKAPPRPRAAAATTASPVRRPVPRSSGPGSRCCRTRTRAAGTS